MLIDNKIDYAATGIKSVYDFILKYTGKGVRKGSLDIVTGFCSLVGLDVLGKELDEENGYRLVLSRLTDGQDSPFRSIDILHNDSGIASAFAVSFIARRVIDFLKRDKVEIRFVAETFCHAKAYLVQGGLYHRIYINPVVNDCDENYLRNILNLCQVRKRSLG
jgi:hypothetical protein